MNLTSASVAAGTARAAAAVTAWLAWPGAPGWITAGFPLAAPPQAETPIASTASGMALGTKNLMSANPIVPKCRIPAMLDAPLAVDIERVADGALPAAERRPQPVRWRLTTRVAFRFAFVYLTLYVLTTQMLAGFWIIPKIEPPNMGATGWIRPPIEWTAAHVFHVGYEYARTETGSGDKTVDWIHAFLLLVFSAVGAAGWSMLDRRRPHYAAMHTWFHLFLRFAAGTTMVAYGSVKAIPLQMPAPNLTRLLEPFGNFSPMGALWYSVGASFP